MSKRWVADDRNWVWLCRFEFFRNCFDQYICYETHECKRVFDDGHVEIFEIGE
jgi:hypothetical protein